MADFIKIADRLYEGASTDTKPSDVPNSTVIIYTNTQARYITYDHGITWILQDSRMRLVNEGGSFIDLPGEFDDVITALGG